MIEFAHTREYFEQQNAELKHLGCKKDDLMNLSEATSQNIDAREQEINALNDKLAKTSLKVLPGKQLDFSYLGLTRLTPTIIEFVGHNAIERIDLTGNTLFVAPSINDVAINGGEACIAQSQPYTPQHLSNRIDVIGLGQARSRHAPNHKGTLEGDVASDDSKSFWRNTCSIQ